MNSKFTFMSLSDHLDCTKPPKSGGSPNHDSQQKHPKTMPYTSIYCILVYYWYHKDEYRNHAKVLTTPHLYTSFGKKTLDWFGFQYFELLQIKAKYEHFWKHVCVMVWWVVVAVGRSNAMIHCMLRGVSFALQGPQWCQPMDDSLRLETMRYKKHSRNHTLQKHGM